jgi:hypothetical protein
MVNVSVNRFFFMYDMIKMIQLKFAFADLNIINNIEWTNTAIYTQMDGIQPDEVGKLVVEYKIKGSDEDWKSIMTDRLYYEEDNMMTIWHSILTFNSMLSNKPCNTYVRAHLTTKDGKIFESGGEDEKYLIRKATGPNLLGDCESFSNIEILKSSNEKCNIDGFFASKILNIESVILNYTFNTWDSASSIQFPYSDSISISIDDVITIQNRVSGTTYFQLKFDVQEMDVMEYYIQVTDRQGELYYDSNCSNNYKRKCSEDNLKTILTDDKLDNRTLSTLSKTLGSLMSDEMSLHTLNNGLDSIKGKMSSDNPLLSLFSEVQDILKEIKQ